MATLLEMVSDYLLCSLKAGQKVTLIVNEFQNYNK